MILPSQPREVGSLWLVWWRRYFFGFCHCSPDSIHFFREKFLFVLQLRVTTLPLTASFLWRASTLLTVKSCSCSWSFGKSYLLQVIHPSVRADPGNGPCQRKVLAEYVNNNNNNPSLWVGYHLVLWSLTRMSWVSLWSFWRRSNTQDLLFSCSCFSKVNEGIAWSQCAFH